MKKEENLTNFDLSILSLSELIKVNEHISDFLKFLDEKRIKPEEKGDKSNE